MINKNGNSEIISKEINDLLESFDKFIIQKNLFVGDIKNAFLNSSNNN